MHVYPNPAKDVVNIQVANLADNVTVKIYDQLGRIVQALDLTTGSINVSGLASGIYYFKIIADNQIFDEKIVIEK